MRDCVFLIRRVKWFATVVLSVIVLSTGGWLVLQLHHGPVNRLTPFPG